MRKFYTFDTFSPILTGWMKHKESPFIEILSFIMTIYYQSVSIRITKGRQRQVGKGGSSFSVGPVVWL